jgi:acyl-CoA synthetase (NDP forming)
MRRCQADYDGPVTLLSIFMQADRAGSALTGENGARTIPSYMFPEAGALALARAVRHGDWRQRDPGEELELGDSEVQQVRDITDRALRRLDGEGGWLDPEEVDGILTAAGLRTPTTHVAGTVEEAQSLASEIDGPVVIKVVSASALHKSDVGGVILGVEGHEEVEDAFAKVTAAVDQYEGVLVQEYIEGGHEVLIGISQDPNFGPLVAYGLGGVYVELLKDVAFRIYPITDVDAAEMVREPKGSRLLEGYRNNPKGDIDALENALQRVSALVTEMPELVEMDLNPVKVLPPGDGIVVVDARMRIRPVPASRSRSLKDLPGVTTNPPRLLT